jgi:hypothetical protein
MITIIAINYNNEHCNSHYGSILFILDQVLTILVRNVLVVTRHVIVISEILAGDIGNLKF